MSAKQSFQVAGVDGCKAGWFVAIASMAKYLAPQSFDSAQDGFIGGSPCVFKLKSSYVTSSFSEVLSKTTDCELICIDIPIGLSDGVKPRECDIAARRLLSGPRASSVFPAPIRQCLCSKDYHTASKICLEHSGKKLNRQSYALLEKIRQVDDLMTPALQQRVREIHPEVSFWALNGQKPMRESKKTVSGQAHRHKLLLRIFTNMDSILANAPVRGYAMDDALDALVAAWTAGQVVLGKAKKLPENPELDNKGLRMEILCPDRYNYQEIKAENS